MQNFVFPVFEFSDTGAVGAFMGVYSTPEKAYGAACRAANSVALFLENELFTSDMMQEYFDGRQSNLVLTGENNLQVIIFYAPMDFDFIRAD